MTIPAAPSQKTYSGDGVSLAFPIPYVFDIPADIKVITTDSSGNISVLATGFSITGGGGSTGTCTFVVAPTALTLITLLDNPTLTQDADYTANDSFPAEAHERALDRTVREVKRLYQLTQRSIRVADGDLIDGDNNLLPIWSSRANRFLAFDATGRPTVSSGTGGGDAALRTDLASGTSGADGSRLTSFRRTNAGAVARSLFSILDQLRLSTDFGLVADGVTDNTAALKAMANANPGLWVIPYNVLFDVKTLMSGLDPDVLFLDLSMINDYTSAGQTSKSIGIISSDVAANDSNLRAVSDHHASFTGNNFGGAGTASALGRYFTVLWACGQFQNGGLTKRGARNAAATQFLKGSGNFWIHKLTHYAPWLAITNNYEQWKAAEVISGAGVYRQNGANHYVSTSAGTTAAGAGPVNGVGSAPTLDGVGGVLWNWIDYSDKSVQQIDQYGRVLIGQGPGTNTFEHMVDPTDPTGGDYVDIRRANGVSKVAQLKMFPTTAGGAQSAQPYFLWQDGVGLRIRNSTNTADLAILADTGLALTEKSMAVAQSATAPATGIGGTIATANLGSSRTNPAGNITGVILEAGTRAGQMCFVANEANFTITFAVAATSNVADGVTGVIPALTGRLFVWNSSNSRWHRAA